MPLRTEVIRKGKEVPGRKLHPQGWDYQLLGMFLTSALQEQFPEWKFRDNETIGSLEGTGKFVDFAWAPIYYMDVSIDLWKKGEQVLKRDHTFGPFEDGSTVQFKEGDVLRMWRE